MSFFIRRGGLALPALLIAIATGTALALPAQAPTSWSPPVQLPAGCVSSGSQPGLALNAAGTEAAPGSQLNADTATSVLVCTSADGQTWPTPATVGQGTSPAVALAPDGRAVTAWDGGPFNAPVIQASVRPPGGTWSAPVTVGTDARGPLIGIDRAGNTIIAWAGTSGMIHTASLPAGGSWTPAQTLATILRQRAGHGGELRRVGGPHLGHKGHGRRKHLCRLRDHPGRLRRAGQSRPSSLPRRADQRRAEQRRGPGGNGMGHGARGHKRGGYPLRGRDVERPGSAVRQRSREPQRRD